MRFSKMLLTFLVARQNHLSGWFWVFALKYWDLKGTYEYYFVIL